jgi:hypothetical protein
LVPESGPVSDMLAPKRIGLSCPKALPLNTDGMAMLVAATAASLLKFRLVITVCSSIYFAKRNVFRYWRVTADLCLSMLLARERVCLASILLGAEEEIFIEWKNGKQTQRFCDH